MSVNLMLYGAILWLWCVAIATYLSDYMRYNANTKRWHIIAYRLCIAYIVVYAFVAAIVLILGL